MRAVISILILCFIFLCIKGVSDLFQERRPNPIKLSPIVGAASIAKTLEMIRPSLLPENDVDKPHCRAARHALETTGHLRFDRQSLQGSSLVFENFGDIEIVLTCINEPMLGVALDEKVQTDPHAWGPPARLMDLVVAEGALMTGAPPKRLRAMAFQCMREADADTYALANVRNGPLEVACRIFRDRGWIASFSVTRR